MIAFAPDEGDEPESYEEEQPAYERYAIEQLKRPEYQRIMIGLKRMARTIVSIRERWQATSRQQTLTELENLLDRQQELEKQIEGIGDVFVREYVYGRLDEAAEKRRSLSSEIRWDVQSGMGAVEQECTDI